METSFKGELGGKAHHGVLKSLGVVYQRVTRISLQNALPYEMFAGGLPYEASKTYRAMRTEFECRKSRALIDANSCLLRGL